tara:strand:- start:5142 stop:5600 length:459 start_codon:yes stop_codon:yes gene_type:complete
MMKNTQKGFTLFIAVLVGSLMLAIGFSIFNLTFKELLLSASARDSQIAFYAADTGLECALYYDQAEDSFITTGPGGLNVNCAGQNVPVNRTAGSGVYSWEWWLDTGGLCTKIEVNKYTSTQRTVIRSLGYNTCTDTDPRRTERGLRVIYSGL